MVLNFWKSDIQFKCYMHTVKVPPNSTRWWNCNGWTLEVQTWNLAKWIRGLSPTRVPNFKTLYHMALWAAIDTSQKTKIMNNNRTKRLKHNGHLHSFDAWSLTMQVKFRVEPELIYHTTPKCVNLLELRTIYAKAINITFLIQILQYPVNHWHS